VNTPANSNLRALIWCAVSSDEQAREGKESLPTQEAEARALSDRHGWTVTDVMIVPGHSRRYIDIHELNESALNEGIDAFEKLLQHWRDCDFDVLIVRDADRFARTQTLHAYITEQTIELGARIYSLADGWIDKSNYRMWIAMAGYKSASHVDWLQKAHAIGMPKRVSKGLPASLLPMSHKVERNEGGKAVRVVINEKNRRMFNDAAQLILQGVAWSDLPLRLYEQYGHANPKNGKPFGPATFRNLFYSPWMWGHAARLYVRTVGGKKPHYKVKKHTGLWTFDEDVPLPPGVEIYRNTVPPLFTGDEAELLKAELRRRYILMEGRAGHKNANTFTGLLVCGSCGCRLSYRKRHNWAHYRCMSNGSAFRYSERYTCTLNKRTVGEKKVIAWLHERLVQMLAAQDLTTFQDTVQVANAPARPEQLQAEINQIEARIASLMVQRADTPEGSQYILTGLIENFDQQLQGLRSALTQIEQIDRAALKAKASASVALEELRAMTLESFWEAPPAEINRLLLMLLGDNRLIIVDGEVVGIGQQSAIRHEMS
jgi:hypothetical protein